MKYVIGNNLVATMAAYLLPNVKHIKPIDKDLDSWNIETFYIPYYCLDFVKLVFPGANVSKYEMRTMYDMRKTLSAVKPKNFDQIYTLYTRGKTNVEKEYLRTISETLEVVSINGESPLNSLIILYEELEKLTAHKCENIDVTSIDTENRLIKLSDDTEYVYDRLLFTSGLSKLISLDSSNTVKGIIEKNYTPGERFALPVIDKYIYKCKLENENDIEISKLFDQIATVGKPWFRKIFYNGSVVYESLKQIFEDKIENNTVNEYIEESQITNTLGIQKVSGIDLLGKCAEWNNSIGFGHVIRRCNSLIEYYSDDEKNHKIIFPGQENLLY